MKYGIMGLGNPEEAYTATRHNIGFRLLDLLADRLSVAFVLQRYGWVAKTKYKGRPLLLLKSNTYMNLSGKALRYYVKREKLLSAALLVLVDDVALPLGRLRLRLKGSAGGHNGLKSIAECLGTEQYARLRFGIGHDFPTGRQSQYVLSPFSPEEEALLVEPMQKALDMVLTFCTFGAREAMNRYH